MSRVFLPLFLLLAVGCAPEVSEEFEHEDLNAAWEEMMDPDMSADSASCSGVVVPDRGPFNGRVALTFDDGPNLTYTSQVLDVLAAHGVTATFFILGKNVRSEAQWDMVRRIMAEGHIIANHTTNHPNSTTLGESSFRNEVASTHTVLTQAGQESLFFRFPYGASNCMTAGVVREFGYSIVGWHIDTADWCFASSTGGVGYCSPSTFRHVPDSYRNDYVGFTLHQLRSNGGGVLLMHDVNSFTVSQLDSMLTALENDGYEIVGLDDATTFPLLNGQEPADQPWIGTPCAGDTECFFTYGQATGYCNLFESGDAGFCALPCEGYCPDRYGHATTFCVDASELGTGMCVGRSEADNEYCASIPGTVATEADRFIGSSGAQASTATVCLPE